MKAELIVKLIKGTYDWGIEGYFIGLMAELIVQLMADLIEGLKGISLNYLLDWVGLIVELTVVFEWRIKRWFEFIWLI